MGQSQGVQLEEASSRDLSAWLSDENDPRATKIREAFKLINLTVPVPCDEVPFGYQYGCLRWVNKTIFNFGDQYVAVREIQAQLQDWLNENGRLDAIRKSVGEDKLLYFSVRIEPGDSYVLYATPAP